jgi:hypothetical protein
MVSEDFLCVIHAHKEYKELDGIAVMIKEMKESKMKSLIVTNAISHGKYTAVHGKIQMSDKTQMDFAEFYEYESHSKTAKILKLDSYVVSVSDTK